MSFKLDSLLERKREGWVGRREEGYRKEEKIKPLKTRQEGGSVFMVNMCVDVSRTKMAEPC